MRTDEELIVAHRTNGCLISFDELLGRHLPRIRDMVLQMVLHDSVADDVTQEVFLRVVRYLPTFNLRSKFSTWLHRVAMNTTHSYLSRQQRLKMESIGEMPDAFASTDAGPVRLAMDGELQKDIEAALGQLTPKLRAAIVLTVLQKLDIREAALIEDCAIATMYWRVHSARKQLQQRLAKQIEL